MNTSTDEFSFLLKPSQHGIGVYAAHDIKVNTRLRLFGNDDLTSIRKREDVPEQFKHFCVHREDGTMICPKDFGQLELGWFLNHSKNPNASNKNYQFFSNRDIKAGEEILIDYNELDEPEEHKEDFYHL